VFELASSEYFKWAAHDDVCQPEFLYECYNILENDPTVVLCYSLTATINSFGKRIKKWRARPQLGSSQPYERFRDILAHIETFPIWGVVRSEILRKTRLLGNYPAHDRPLLAELSLSGRFFEVQEYLFLDREHPRRSIRAHDPGKPHDAVVWYDPKRSGRIVFPAWRLLGEYLAAINRSPIKRHIRLQCYLEMLKWLKVNWQKLVNDMLIATERTPVIGEKITRAHNSLIDSQWLYKTKQAIKELRSLIPPGETLIIVDENTLASRFFSPWKKLPFIEREGQYWGPPPDNDTAINELERLRLSGADFIVFIWPSFWWLDHFTEFYRYLHMRFNCLARNNRVVVFDLRRKTENIGL
jgi:hypothetical protein